MEGYSRYEESDRVRWVEKSKEDRGQNLESNRMSGFKMTEREDSDGSEDESDILDCLLEIDEIEMCQIFCDNVFISIHLKQQL